MNDDLHLHLENNNLEIHLRLSRDETRTIPSHDPVYLIILTFPSTTSPPSFPRPAFPHRVPSC